LGSRATADPSLLQEVRKHASSNVELLMVGNKHDLVEKRKVSEAEAQVGHSFRFGCVIRHSLADMCVRLVAT
jgi:GTP1/Obg family GTP-binding protein